MIDQSTIDADRAAVQAAQDKLMADTAAYDLQQKHESAWQRAADAVSVYGDEAKAKVEAIWAELKAVL